MADEKKTTIRLRDLFTGTSEEKAGQLATKRKEMAAQLSLDKQDWALNREFYKGNQWTYYNESSDRVEALPNARQGARYRVRLVSNQIQPGVQHWVAQLTKNKPIIGATPNTASDRDRKAAETAQDLFESWWREFSLTAKTQAALTHAALSQGFWHITWDGLAGKSMKVTVDPEGQPITDDDLAEVFAEELESVGLDPKQFERHVAVGEIDIKVVPGENVLLGPGATFEDVKYAIVTENLTVDEIEARWPGTKVEPDAISGEDAIAVSFTKMRDERPKDVRRVHHMYVRPHAALPKGRYTCWIEDPNKTLVDTEWHLPHDELPLVKFPGIERPNSPLDIPVTTAARPIQYELNRSISQVMEHKNLTLKPQMIAPEGSLRQRLTSEPGAIFTFNPVAGLEPKWREMPNLPSYVFDALGWAKQQLDQIYNKIPTGRDQLPARMDSGDGIDLIQESVADQLSPIIDRLSLALVRAGMIMAQLAQEYYTEFRTMKVVGPGGATRSKKFHRADLAGGFSFYAESQSGLPRTRSGKQKRIEFMLTNQLIDPVTALKHLDVADMGGLLAQIAADEEHAEREVDKILRGIPINPSAMREAMAVLQQGLNPETGEPLNEEDPQAEAMQVLEHASLQPLPFENKQAHLKVLQKVLVSAEFDNYPPDAQDRFQLHFQLTQQALQAEMQQPGEAPRINFALKGTTSAPVAGELLRKAGINVTDEQVAEEPLETWVTDSMDKPDMDSAGNDPFTEEEKILAMRREEEKHSLQMAKTAHEVAQAQQKVNSNAQAETHAEEMHQERLNQMRKPAPAKAA